jgi:ribosome-binding protein aMBF1 (putative translation factor)
MPNHTDPDAYIAQPCACADWPSIKNQKPKITMNAPSATTASLLAACIAAAAALAKKFLPRKKPAPEYITRTEFHSAIDATRDRIGASYLALADKIELQHNQVLTVLDRQGENFERRLDAIETTMARFDERLNTKTTNKVPVR